MIGPTAVRNGGGSRSISNNACIVTGYHDINHKTLEVEEVAGRMRTDLSSRVTLGVRTPSIFFPIIVVS
jgi:hypothetical protein